MRIPLFLLLSASALLALEVPKSRTITPSATPAPAPTPPPELAVPEDSRPFTADAAGAGVSVDGTDEELRPFTFLTLAFPDDMVEADKIDVRDAELPIAIWPDLNAEFTWRTQSQGDVMIKGPIIPGQTYRFRLREGLKNLDGQPLPQDAWGVTMTAPELAIVEEGYGQRDRLNSRPQVPIEFNYPIRLSDAAQGIWFQDRASRQRFPAEILLNTAEGDLEKASVVDAAPDAEEKSYSFRVRPLSPLPVGHFYDLVVEGVHDAYAGRTLPFPRVFPLGTTRPLEIDYAAARNFPLEKPQIEVKFRQYLGDEPLPNDALAITPAVPNLHVRKSGQFLIAEGDFDTAQRYQVVISDQIPGIGGYGLARPETWGATFRPKQAAILFPGRQVRERSALGLRFAFYHVNTSELEWKLAAIPLAKLPEVLARETEFTAELEDEDNNPVWTEDGLLKHAPSEPLIAALGLTVAGSGAIPAAGEKEVLREISWKPDDPGVLGGPMLLEVTGKDAKGRVIGNRAMIYFGETAVTRKSAEGKTVVRVARLGDGLPVPGAGVSALNAKMEELAKAVTDPEGLATFTEQEIPACEYFLIHSDKALTLQPLSLSDRFYGASSSPTLPPRLRGYTLTDRPLYRPQQSVQFKGFVREETGGSLAIPRGKTVKWSIEKRYGGSEVLATGEAKVDAEGSWNGAWTPPENAPLGDFVVKAAIDGQTPGSPAGFQIEEFRNPPFSVVCEEEKAAQPAESVVSVRSQYFHGAPNAGASVKWTASWTSDSDGGYYHGGDDGMTRVDLYSEHAPKPSWSAEISGETALDGNGKATLRCEAPFKDPGNRARCYVNWKVEVTGPDGQTITGGANGEIPMEAVLLGVKRNSAENGTLTFEWDAAESGFAKAPEAVQAGLFHVETKSVKERLAPNVYRYRNFDQYHLVEKRDRVTEAELVFTPKTPGRYVLVVSPLPGQPGFAVSDEAFLEGAEESEVPVESDTAATVFSVNGKAPNDQPWKVGENAVLNVLSPSSGIAWVSVETDKILDTFTVPIEGNTSRLEIPVKPEYEPNVTVSVYILRPGGSDALAGEMFGYTELSVIAPDRSLSLAVTTAKSDYEPREKISGEVAVTSAGKPVANADLAIYAVDDAILTLGDWQLPQLLSSFFLSRPYAVLTYSALKAYVDKISPSWLTMKGFVAGDGGAEEFGNITFTRKEFKPLILWQPNVKTDAQGVAKFTCEAPDNLTRFRVIAVGQTKSSQFGAGDTMFTVSKKLQIEPALPRFLREGDEVELRAVARQKTAESGKLLVRCTAGGGLELTSPPQQEITAEKDAPVVVRFKARAKSVGSGLVKFEIVSTADPKRNDAVEMTLPIAEPVILNKESVGGEIAGTSFSATVPEGWKDRHGTFQLAVSTTPWLAKLMGLPYLLEYPHGCFEQKSSRLLACTYLGGLLEYLPDGGTRKENYGRVIERTLSEFETGLLPSGLLPYWPNGVEPNIFVTIQSAWCVTQAEQAGFAVPERLSDELPEALERIVTGKARLNASPSLRAFALFVLSTFEGEKSGDLAAAADELFLQRDKLTGEGLAMLAIALNRLELTPERQKQLVAELPVRYDGIAFNPETFSSATRTEALCTWARLAITPGADDASLRARLSKLMESSASLSTQENLWLLVAFDALLKQTSFTPLKPGALKPKPDVLSTNATGAAWAPQDLARLAGFAIAGLPALKTPGSYVLSAAYRTPEILTPLVNHGIKIERVVKNLTEAARNGSAQAPFKLGDQLFISYRFSSNNSQSYVALEDSLPAGFEVVNPNLAMFGKYFDVPSEPGVTEAPLSHSEMRDQQTVLYFDRLPSGAQGYGVLARATAAGTFIWPATQIAPMYDSRFFGRSPSSVCVVSAE